VVSWYFSAKYSHKQVYPIPELRSNLERLDMNGGLKYIVDAWSDFGLFEAQRSWMAAPAEKQGVRIFGYEDFARDNYAFLKILLDYLEIRMPVQELDALYARHEFSQLSGGREQGNEDQMSHFRKGTSGDWRNYFDDDVMAHFRDVTGDLLEVLGYGE
jgi:hypothetical protein